MHFDFFSQVHEYLLTRFKLAETAKPKNWQGINVEHDPSATTKELLFINFSLANNYKGFDELKEDVKPDLPWADDHFNERVSGSPLNPPPSEAWWPHAPQGNSRFKEGDIFNHTYPERYWPKFAGDDRVIARRGIRQVYGDLNDVISLLLSDPLTRQAYLPVWFPEDTGGPVDTRKPCTLGYHFIMINGKLSITYYIRSCDFVRHFRNDVYLTLRLQRWVLSRLQQVDRLWYQVKPGFFRMDIVSLHLFINDYNSLMSSNDPIDR